MTDAEFALECMFGCEDASTRTFHKTTLIITDQTDPIREEGVMKLSNAQWALGPTRLEGHEFGDVIVKCKPADSLRDWLHMHIGFRIDRIIYESPF